MVYNQLQPPFAPTTAYIMLQWIAKSCEISAFLLMPYSNVVLAWSMRGLRTVHALLGFSALRLMHGSWPNVCLRQCQSPSLLIWRTLRALQHLRCPTWIMLVEVTAVMEKHGIWCHMIEFGVAWASCLLNSFDRCHNVLRWIGNFKEAAGPGWSSLRPYIVSLSEHFWHVLCHSGSFAFNRRFLALWVSDRLSCNYDASSVNSLPAIRITGAYPVFLEGGRPLVTAKDLSFQSYIITNLPEE